MPTLITFIYLFIFNANMWRHRNKVSSVHDVYPIVYEMATRCKISWIHTNAAVVKYLNGEHVLAINIEQWNEIQN